MSHPEIIRGKTRTGHMAHSEASGRVLSAGVLGDKCLFRKAPGGWSGSLPVGRSVWAPGRVALSPDVWGGGCLGFGARDRWHSPKVVPKGLSLLGLRDIRHISKRVFRLDLRDAWHSPKLSPKGFSKEVSKGWLSGWLSGHVACSEGWSEGGFEKGLLACFGKALK